MTLIYMCTKIKREQDFFIFLSINQCDIIFNEDVKEYLSLDLHHLFFKIVSHDQISSHLIETFVIDIFNVTQKYQKEISALNDMMQILFCVQASVW